jgi:hypothetical protein
MPFLNDRVFDNGLSVLSTETEEMHICSQEPVDFTGASATHSLGSTATVSVAAPSDRSAGGREVAIAAVTDGAIDANGTATHYALVDATNSRLLAAGALATSQQVANGNTWATAEFKIGFPDPA